MMEKGAKREPKWSPKSDQNGHKEPKGSPRAAQKAEKAGKKEGGKTEGKKEGKKRSFAENTGRTAECAGPRKKAFMRKGIYEDFTRPLRPAA